MDEGVRDLPHTADIGFKVHANTRSRLFELAAEGLIRALGAPHGGALDSAVRKQYSAAPQTDRGAPATTETLHLERPDVDRLLVAWLRELLHRALSEQRIPERIRVEITDRGGRTGRTPGVAEAAAAGSAVLVLDAEVGWADWPAEAGPMREVKGVTYHGLHVEPHEGGWRVEVYLDV